MPKRAQVLTAFGLDLALVLLFTITGRISHGMQTTLLGVLETAWPFVVALTLSLLLVRFWKQPFSMLRAALAATGTVLLAVLLRVLTQQGTFSPVFIGISLAALLLFLVGWRAVYAGLQMLNRTPRQD